MVLGRKRARRCSWCFKKTSVKGEKASNLFSYMKVSRDIIFFLSLTGFFCRGLTWQRGCFGAVCSKKASLGPCCSLVGEDPSLVSSRCPQGGDTAPATVPLVSPPRVALHKRYLSVCPLLARAGSTTCTSTNPPAAGRINRCNLGIKYKKREQNPPKTHPGPGFAFLPAHQGMFVFVLSACSGLS